MLSRTYESSSRDSDIDRLLEAVHPNAIRNGVFMMVKSYWDESGINPDSPVCLIAGYFGGVNQWRIFDRQWKNILNREKVREFHAKEFWALSDGQRVGQYAGWDDARATRFLDDLVDVARSVKIYPAGTTIVRKDWEQLPEHQRRYFTGARYHKITHKRGTTGAPSQPYFLCFLYCVDVAAKYTVKHLKLHCAFDLNQSFKGHAQILWSVIRTDKRLSYCGQLGDLALPTSEEAPGLQLADLFAFRSRRYAEKKLKDPRAPIGVFLLKLLGRLKAEKDFLFINHEVLKAMLEGIPEYLRGDVVDSKYANAKETSSEEGNEQTDAAPDERRIPQAS